MTRRAKLLGLDAVAKIERAEPPDSEALIAKLAAALSEESDPCT